MYQNPGYSIFGWIPTTPIIDKEPKRFIKCSHAGHTIIVDDEFINSIPLEPRSKMDLPCKRKNVSAEEIRARVKVARPYTETN